MWLSLNIVPVPSVHRFKLNQRIYNILYFFESQVISFSQVGIQFWIWHFKFVSSWFGSCCFWEYILLRNYSNFPDKHSFDRVKLFRNIKHFENRWHKIGPSKLMFRRFSFMIKRIQLWWRRYSARMHNLRNVVSKQWRQMERHIVVEELRKVLPVKINKLPTVSSSFCFQNHFTVVS